MILLVDPKRFVFSSWQTRRKVHNDIGEIIGVQSRNTFLAKLYTERVPVKRFDMVEFRYSMDEEHRVFKGMIVDNFLLNEQQWVKILANDSIRQAIGSESNIVSDNYNVVCKIQDCHIPEFLGRFVGVVIDRSNIMKIRFNYAGRVKVFEGNLLEAIIAGKQVLYQVTQGLTEVEPLEQKNEAGFIVGEAVQLGIWDSKKLFFEKYGWVPEVNTPLFIATKAPDFVVEEGKSKSVQSPELIIPCY